MHETIAQYLQLLVRHNALIPGGALLILSDEPLYASIGVEYPTRKFSLDAVVCIVSYDARNQRYSIALPTSKQPHYLDNAHSAAEAILPWAAKTSYLTITEVNQAKGTEKIIAQHHYNDGASNVRKSLLFVVLALVLLCACLFVYRYYSTPTIKYAGGETINNTGHQRSADAVDAQTSGASNAQ